jgi:hypothetical protein
VKCDLSVDPGRTLACKLLDPDGKPVEGARVTGLTTSPYWEERPLPGDGFTLTALHPKKARWVVVLHPQRQLGAALEVKAGARGPVRIPLRRTGTITGRLLDPAGRPWRRLDLSILFELRGERFLYEHPPGVLRTDGRGRFRVRGVLPGLTYRINVPGKPPGFAASPVATRLVLKPGEVRDLGDLKARLPRE